MVHVGFTGMKTLVSRVRTRTSCHNTPPKIETQATLEKGTSFGAPSVQENILAKMVIAAVPSVEMVRFTNSGTEVR